MGQLTLSMGPARAEVCCYVQRATIPSKRVLHTLKIHKYHTCNNFLHFCIMLHAKIKYISPLQVKNKPRDRETKHAFILVKWTVQL